jgi:hypothetical protein
MKSFFKDFRTCSSVVYLFLTISLLQYTLLYWLLITDDAPLCYEYYNSVKYLNMLTEINFVPAKMFINTAWNLMLAGWVLTPSPHFFWLYMHVLYMWNCIKLATIIIYCILLISNEMQKPCAIQQYLTFYIYIYILTIYNYNKLILKCMFQP